jgi:hypothetical protein
MKTITIILSFSQARYLLNNLPVGSAIKISVKDANRIIDSEPSTKKENRNKRL